MKYHEPVLKAEVSEALKVKKGGKYIDCTLGDGGHAVEIIEAGGTVLGIDLDAGSIKRALERIGEKNFKAIQGNFENLEKIAQENNFSQVEGIIYDLGYSTTQIEDKNMGLSFSRDQPLDMRLDKNLDVTAADLVNSLPEKELTKMFREFGEERNSKRIAAEIIKVRGLKKIESTKELADLIVGTSPPGYDKRRLHPATRVFQALRIATNSELQSLKISLPQAARLLLPGGRMAVISFHSLEDRLVKQFGKAVQAVEIITYKLIKATREEIDLNPGARSAKLRVFEKR